MRLMTLYWSAVISFLSRYCVPYLLNISATSGDLVSSFILSLLLFVHQIERTLELDVACRDQMQVDGGRFYGGVAEQPADSVEVVALIEQVGGEAVTEGVEAALFG